MKFYDRLLFSCLLLGEQSTAADRETIRPTYYKTYQIICWMRNGFVRSDCICCDD